VAGDPPGAQEGQEDAQAPGGEAVAAEVDDGGAAPRDAAHLFEDAAVAFVVEVVEEKG
jgi:hypothetical protein